MRGHSRSKNGVVSRAYDPRIHHLSKDVHHLRKEDGSHRNSGLPEFRKIECPSRVYPTWVSSPAMTREPVHCALMPLSLTTWPHLSISLTMKAPNSAALMRTMSAPSDSRRFCVSGESCAAASAACTLSTISLGVPAGARMPHQLVAS